MLGPFGVNKVAQPFQLASEYLLIEKKQCGQRLVLCGSADFRFAGQVGKVGAYLDTAHLVGVALAVK
jgi:hypothetical protein